MFVNKKNQYIGVQSIGSDQKTDRFNLSINASFSRIANLANMNDI